MRIQGEGLADEQGDGLRQHDKVIYVLHPNCAVDEVG